MKDYRITVNIELFMEPYLDVWTCYRQIKLVNSFNEKKMIYLSMNKETISLPGLARHCYYLFLKIKDISFVIYKANILLYKTLIYEGQFQNTKFCSRGCQFPLYTSIPVDWFRLFHVHAKLTTLILSILSIKI